jgi:CubicO group peptidase (beta-lactamase class C family)
MGNNPRAFGHNAAGGSVGWADTEAHLGVAITHNRMIPHGPPEENPLVPIGEAVREALGVPG